MKEKKCSECGKINSSKAKFCQGCGKKLEVKKEFCIECGAPLDSDAVFCKKCGTKKGNTDIVKNNAKDIPWNFDSKSITVCFFICALSGTFLLASDGFVPKLFRSMEDGRPFGIISFIIGAILLFIENSNKKIDLKNDLKKEIENLKQFKLTKNIVGIVLLLAGIIITLNLGSSDISGDIYGLPIIALFFSFITLGFTIFLKNYKKIENKVSIINQVLTLICSIILAIGFVYFNSTGKEMNSDFAYQLESVMEYGRANPGDEFITYSVYALIGAIVFLVLFFVLRSDKVKNNIEFNKYLIGFYVFAFLIMFPFLIVYMGCNIF